MITKIAYYLAIFFYFILIILELILFLNKKLQLMDCLEIIIIMIAGLVAGFINTVAGSGSVVSLSILMFLGIPANIANGTNRIAILMQNTAGVIGFKKQKVFEFKQGIWLAIPALFGSIVGALFATNINEDILEKTIGAVILCLFVLMIFKPKIWEQGDAKKLKTKPNLFQILAFFSIGVYGGFIQVGVGFFLLASLVLGAGFDLIKANAQKLFIALLYTPIALVIFISNDQVNFVLGLILGIGNIIGALLGVKFSIKNGARIVKYILMGVMILASFKFLGVFNYIINLI